MSHLGSFGAAVKELNPHADKDEFDYFGEKFTVYGTVPPIIMVQLGAALAGRIEESEGFAAIWYAMETWLTVPGQPEDGDTPATEPDDSQFQRWYKLNLEKKDDFHDLLRLCTALFGAQSARPTEEPQGSSPGDSTTSPSSNGSSSTLPLYPGMRAVKDIVAG
jgi:hypothetical protein